MEVERQSYTYTDILEKRIYLKSTKIQKEL